MKCRSKICYIEDSIIWLPKYYYIESIHHVIITNRYIYILHKQTQGKSFCIHTLKMVMYKTVGCLANCDFHFLYVTFISKLHM